MSAVMERQIRGDRKPRVNLCGSCGTELPDTELLCAECRNEPTPEPRAKDTEANY